MAVDLSPSEGGPVRCLLAAVGNSQMLLPHACVAEIVNVDEREQLTGAPTWYAGRFVWRGENVPLVSLQHLSGDVAAEAPRRIRVLVINPLTKRAELPFYGILVNELPRPVLVDRGDVRMVEQGITKGRGVLTHVTLGGQAAMIPDLDSLEGLLHEHAH